MSISIEPCHSESVLTYGGYGLIGEGKERPESTIGCMTAEEPHIIACVDVVDEDNNRLIQMKRFGDKYMPMIASAGHAKANDSLNGIPVLSRDSLNYLKEEATRETKEELGGELAEYLGITPGNLFIQGFDLDREVLDESMNHLTLIFRRRIEALDNKMVQSLFSPNEEVDSLRVYSPQDLKEFLNNVDDSIFFYQPFKALMQKWLDQI